MQRIKGRLLFAVVAFGLAILRAPASVVAAEKPAKLRTAYVSPIGAMAPVWMAAASSAFQTEGIDVELVYIQSNAAIAALVAGEVDAVQISAPAIVPVVLAGGNITMIAGLLMSAYFGPVQVHPSGFFTGELYIRFRNPAFAEIYLRQEQPPL